MLAGFAVALLAACGGEDRGAKLADCNQHWHSLYDARSAAERAAVPRPAWDETGRRLCEQAVAAELDAGNQSDAAVQARLSGIVKRHPEIYFPICEATAIHDFRHLPSGQQTGELRGAFLQYGRRLCVARIRSGSLVGGAPMTEEEATDLIARHPEIAEPVCVTTALQSYERNPIVIRGQKLSRKAAAAFASRFCRAALSRKLMSVSGSGTPAQRRALRALALETEQRMIAAGELP